MKNISYRLSVSIHPSRQFLSRRVLLGECNKSSVWRVLSEPWLLTSEERPQWVRLHLCRCNLYVKWIFPQVDYIRQWPLKTKCVIIFSQLWHVPLSDRAVTSWLQDRIFFSVNPLVNTHVNRHGCVRIKACVCVCVCECIHLYLDVKISVIHLSEYMCIFLFDLKWTSYYMRDLTQAKFVIKSEIPVEVKSSRSLKSAACVLSVSSSLPRQEEATASTTGPQLISIKVRHGYTYTTRSAHGQF